MNSFAARRLVEEPRSADEIARLLERLLDEVKPAARGADPLREALVRIAARYGEIVTKSLNASADLHLAAFTELLGVPRRCEGRAPQGAADANAMPVLPAPVGAVGAGSASAPRHRRAPPQARRRAG